MPSRPNARRLARLGLLAAIGVVLGGLEYALPPLLPQLPGARLGLGNLPVVAALYGMGLPAALAVCLVRAVVTAFLFTSPAGMLYSLGGGMLAVCGMALCKRWKGFSMLGVSAAGAQLHQTGQLAVALLLTRSAAVLGYWPYLAALAVPTGLFIGWCAHALMGLWRKVFK